MRTMVVSAGNGGLEVDVEVEVKGSEDVFVVGVGVAASVVGLSIDRRSAAE